MSLTATERLNRLGAAKAKPPEVLKSSIAAMRRMSADEVTVTEVTKEDVAYSMASDSVQVGPSPSIKTVSAEQAPDLQVALRDIRATLETIGGSVQFTEAYVSAGITNNIKELLSKEIAMAERLGAIQSKYKSRQVMLVMIIVALAVLLVTEAQFDYLSAFTADVATVLGGVFASVLQGLGWAFASLGGLFPS